MEVGVPRLPLGPEAVSTSSTAKDSEERSSDGKAKGDVSGLQSLSTLYSVPSFFL